MKTWVLLILLFPILALAQEPRYVYGKITDGGNALENVKITTRKTGAVTASNNQGSYRIAVDTVDIISFTYVGMKDLEILIEDITKILNIVMVPQISELDEVVVTASKRRKSRSMEKEFATNKNIIKTAYGYLDKETSAARIRILSGEY